MPVNSRTPAAQIKYERFPGRSMGFATRATLWLGPDHLLLVHEGMTGENYRRFFFRDIEAIVVRRSDRGRTAGIALGLLALVNLLPLFAIGSPAQSTRGLAWLALGSALWAALLLVSLARGPTCETRIRTAVQDDVVPSLGRRRIAERVIARIRPLILEAQSQPVGEGIP
jgi:hypothetical protein